MLSYSALPQPLSSISSPTAVSTDNEQIRTLERRVASLGIAGLKDEHLTYALQYTQGDVEKAFELLMLVEDSIEGIIKGYSPSTKLLGAENREGVTCFLDALLFAMFARLDCFEGILYKHFSDESRGKLSMLLRLWVNMLRSGKLITTDIVSNWPATWSNFPRMKTNRFMFEDKTYTRGTV